MLLWHQVFLSNTNNLHMVLHTYIYWIHTDAMITDTVINDA